MEKRPLVFEEIKDRIRFRLLSREVFRDYLELFLWRPVTEGIILVYYMEKERTAEKEAGETFDRYNLFDFQEKHLKEMGISREQMEAAAMKNMQKYHSLDVQNISREMVQVQEKLGTLTDETREYFSKEENQVYKMGLHGSYYGAAAMAYPHVLDFVAELMGGDFILYPTSVCGVMLTQIPEVEPVPYQEMLKQMMGSNREFLTPVEYLDFAVYHYHANEKRLERKGGDGTWHLT